MKYLVISFFILMFGIFLVEKYKPTQEKVVEKAISLKVQQIVDTPKVKSDSLNVSLSEIEKRKKDPTIKTLQDVAFVDGLYCLTTTGWFQGDVVYYTFFDGTSEELMKIKKKEKEKCNNFLYHFDKSALNKLKLEE